MAAGKLMRPDHPAASVLARAAREHSISIAQLSLAWLLHRSPVLVPIPGTSRVSHLEENVAAASAALPPDIWAEIENAVR